MAWLDGWLYRKKLTITGSSAGAQTNYETGIKVYYTSGVDGTETIDGTIYGKVYIDSKCETDFDDIRFTESDGETEIDYALYSKTDSDNAIFWAEVPSIPASPSTVDIYIYYGNDIASSTSNKDNTFILYADFETDVEGFSDSNLLVVNHTGNRVDDATQGWCGHAEETGSGYQAENIPCSIESSLYKTITKASGEDLAVQVGNWRATADLDSTCRFWVSVQVDETTPGSITQHIYYEGEGVDSGWQTDTAWHELAGLSGNTTLAIAYGAADSWSAYYNQQCWFDDLFVRSYANPEPTHTAWGPEKEEVESYRHKFIVTIG